ncbi:MAG TPA: ATPase [Methanomicrobiales archaeon]|nr:ATPase [Methanomicrobiales archaeon]
MALPIEPSVVPTLAGLTTEMITASQVGTKALAASIAISTTAFATALAEYAIGTAAVGATAEKPEVFGSVLILTVIPETIVIFGLVVALLLII